MELQTFYSLDDENYPFDEFKDLLDHLHCIGDLVVGRIYYEADFRFMNATDIFNIDSLMEDLDCQLYDLVGESGDAGLDASHETIIELESHIMRWINEHTDVADFRRSVGEPRKRQIHTDDIAQFQLENETHKCASSAIDDVIAERVRQVEVEGWTSEHDDAHKPGELSSAAMGYVQSAACQLSHDGLKLEGTPLFWPWDSSWFKPSTPQRDLVKAAALILAEIERLDRAAAEIGRK